MATATESFSSSALIGIEYTIELANASNQEPDNYCVLCNKTSSKRNVFAHWSSFDHRLKYLDKHFKSVAMIINNLRQKSNIVDSSLTSIVRSVAVEIEKKYGRLEHLTISRDEFRRSRSKYLRNISNMKHFNEQMGSDFVNIVKEAIANANLDGNKNINKENQNSVIDVEMSNQRNIEATTGRNKEYIEESESKSIDLDEISSDSDSNNESLKSANQLPHKKNLKRTINQSPQLDSCNLNKNSSQHKANNEINNKKILHSLSLQASHIAQERYKWEKFFSIVDMEAKKLDTLQNEYDKNPESHPDYPTEWIKFWNRRSKELQGKKVDLNMYDFKPEWISYWRERMQKLLEFALEKKKYEIKEQLGLREEDAHKFEHLNDKYKISNRSKSISNFENNVDKINRSKRARKVSLSSHHGTEGIAKRTAIDTYNIDDDDDEIDFRSFSRRHEKRRSRSRSHSPKRRHSLRSSKRQNSPRRHLSPRRRLSRSPRRHTSRSPRRNSLRSSRNHSSRSPMRYSSRSPRRLSPRSQRLYTLHTHSVHSRSPKHSRSPFGRRRSRSFSMSPLPSDRNGSSLPYIQRCGNLSRSHSHSPPQYGSDILLRNLERNSLGPQHEHLGRHIDSFHGDRQPHRDETQYESLVYSRLMRMYSSSAEDSKRIRIIDSRDYPEYMAADRPVKSPFEETVVETSIDEGPLTLVSVLRTLSALEQHLGSLGPKTLDLLSKALAIEKVKANESDSLLLNDDYCVFLETIKEKLKGLLITDLLNESKKIRVIKQVIKNIATLIHQVNSKDNTTNNKNNEHSQPNDGFNKSNDQQTKDLNKDTPPLDYPFDRDMVASRLAATLVARGCDKISTTEMCKLIKFFVLLVKLNKRRHQINGKNLDFDEILNILSINNQTQTNQNHHSNNFVGSNVNDVSEYNSNKIPLKENIQLSSTMPLSLSLPIINDAIKKEITEMVREVEMQSRSSTCISKDVAAPSSSDRTNTVANSDTDNGSGGEGGASDNNDSSHQMFLLTDAELKVLIKNFKFLSNDEQDHLITHLKKLEVEEPSREQSLRKYVDVADLSDEIGPCSDVLSKLTKSSDTTKIKSSGKIMDDRNKDVLVASSTNPADNVITPTEESNINFEQNYKTDGGVNNDSRIEDDDDDEDDYNFDEVFLNNNFRKSKSKSPMLNSKTSSSPSSVLPVETSLNALTFKPPETRLPLLKDTESLIANLMGSLQQNATASSKLNQNNSNITSSTIFMGNNNCGHISSSKNENGRFIVGGGSGINVDTIGSTNSQTGAKNSTIMAHRNQMLHSHPQQQIGHGVSRGQQQPMPILQQQQPSICNIPTSCAGNNVNMRQHYQHNLQILQQTYMSGVVPGQQSQQPNIHYNQMYGYQNSGYNTNFQHSRGGLWQQPESEPPPTRDQYILQQHHPLPQQQQMPPFNTIYSRQHGIGGGNGSGSVGN